MAVTWVQIPLASPPAIVVVAGYSFSFLYIGNAEYESCIVIARSAKIVVVGWTIKTQYVPLAQLVEQAAFNR